MRTHVLMYHGFDRCGGAAGAPGPRSYTLPLDGFRAHVRAIAPTIGGPPWNGLDPGAVMGSGHMWAITFDDGLESALWAADVVEGHGWRAHFFIVSGWIGRPGYMTADHLRDLGRRGHSIGSHSVSHPDPMSALPYAALLEQWRESAEALGEVLGEPVRTASIPGGSLSVSVAAAAAEAGLDLLFTSEPVSRIYRCGGCAVVGRYAIQRGFRPETAARLVAGRPLARASRWTGWNARKIARRLMGGSYYVVRRRLLGGRV